MIGMVALLLLIVGIAVNMIVRTTLIKDSYDILLQYNEYSIGQKKSRNKLEVVGEIYWLVITASYLAVSFFTKAWGITWIIWPIAGILSGIINLIFDNKSNSPD